MNELSRRGFLAAAPAVAAAAGVVRAAKGAPPRLGDEHRGVAAISSSNGLRSVERARALVLDGYDPADAVVAGVRIVEDDPNDTSVGLGGLPNADGVVELDACVMHGPTHKSGAVASIRNIKNPAAVALLVLRRTDHCLLVGEGALRFAKSHGFEEENLLTEASRREWMKWKENMSKDDDWLNADERDEPAGKTFDDPRKVAFERSPVVHHTGTIHCSVVTPEGDIASTTSTSGLSWKIPGRVGDSPIIGAGNYCDNAVGAGGATGRGEAAIVNLAGFTIVELMSRGMTPTEACLAVAKRVADHTLEKRLRTPKGRPNFGVSFYGLRKDGAWGGAALYPGGTMTVADSEGARSVEVPAVFDRME